MGIFTRRLNVAKAKKASLQERGPKNNYERATLQALQRAKIRVETIYGVKIQKMPYVIVTARKIIPDRETDAAYFKELEAHGQLSKNHCKALIAYKPRGFDAFGESVWRACRFATHASRVTYHNSLQTIEMPPAVILGPNAVTWLEEVLAHELVHHVLWEQKSPVYTPHKHSMYATPSLASQAANEGLAMHVQKWHGIPVLKNVEELGAAIIKYPINLIGGIIGAFYLAVRNPICFMVLTTGAFISAATRLRKFVAVVVRNTTWWEQKEFVRALAKYPIAQDAFDIYSDGIAFVNEVIMAFSNQKRAFDIITNMPPKNLEEILIPETYLERVRKDAQAESRNSE